MPIKRWFETEQGARNAAEKFLQRLRDNPPQDWSRSYPNGRRIVSSTGDFIDPDSADIFRTGVIWIKKSFVPNEEELHNPVYVPSIACSVHPSRFQVQISDLLNKPVREVDQYRCTVCWDICSHCGSIHSAGQPGNLCQRCHLNGITWCREHDYFFTFGNTCERCLLERLLEETGD